MPDDEADFIDTEAVAAYLKMSPATVKFWRYQRKGPPFVRVPGSQQVLYSRGELETWLTAGQIDPAKRKRGRPRKSTTCTVPSRSLPELEPRAAAQ
jgi:hypothetical protein